MKKKTSRKLQLQRRAMARFNHLPTRWTDSDAFEIGYRAAMSDVRKILAAVEREYPEHTEVAVRRLVKLARIRDWVRPLR